MQVRLRIKEPIGHRPHWWQRLPNRWPFFVWLAAGGLAVALYFHGGKLGGIMGVVTADRQNLAPIEAGLLKAVYVNAGDAVKKGQLLAEMDTSLLDAEMMVERLQIQRQFAQAILRSEQALYDARIRQAETEGELAILQDEVARLEGLVARQLVDAQTLARTRARLEALRRAAELYPALIAALEKDLGEGMARRNTLEGFLEDETERTANAQGEELGNVLGNHLELLRLRRERYHLHAEFDGEVSRVFHSAGETVLAGDPILTIVGRRITGAEGFLPEGTVADVRPGMKVYVTTTARLSTSVRGRIVSVTPDVMALPGRANPIPQRILRGRRVAVVFDEPAPFIAGESVAIQFEQPLITRLLGRLFGVGGHSSEASAP
jgi:multidrug resistance efflux pump